MSKITNLLALIILTLFLSGCKGLFLPMTMDLEVPDGPPEYQAGWQDGCSSALSAGGYGSAKFHKLSMGDGSYQHDSTYQSAWGSGWFACVIQAGGYTGHTGINASPFD
ncbi:MAG: hypothetical protein ACJAZX_001076 [Rickettsiales bacterium]|jgi:hypothetical protein